MAEGRACALRSIELGVPDVERSRGFYENVWGLQLVDRVDGTAYLRATGPEHHVVVLHERPESGVVRVNLAAPDRAAVDALYESVRRAGAVPLGEPAALDLPGGGYGFAFHDPEGREFRVSSDVASHADAHAELDLPFKLSHVVLNAADATRSSAFLREGLGFRLRDQTKMMDFLGCNPDHHSIALTRVGNTSLNHVAFELPTWNGLMYASGRLRREGFDIQWGVGRHGPGNNVFAYFIEPAEIAVEYTAEVEQIDDATYRTGTPSDWNRGTDNPDRWGLAAPPSERYRRITHGPSKH
jgi:catechol 2,3-dioxygenase